jgi:hypothetical protein
VTLDPASRELLQAINAALDVRPKPTRTAEVMDWWQQVANRAAVVRTVVNTLLEHQARQEERAREFAAELRRIVAEQAGRAGAPPDPPLLTRPHDWPPKGGDR